MFPPHTEKPDQGILLSPGQTGPAATNSSSIQGGVLQAVKQILKGIVLGLTFVVAALPAALCNLEAICSSRNDLFLFWGQTFALVPGLPGVFLRRCFYYWTLKTCSLSSTIGYLTYFTLRDAEVGPRVYIGVSAMLGSVSLGEGSLIGSRVSIVNGGWQHQFGADGKLTPCNPATLPRIRIGAETWVGEGAVLLADVGDRCIVAAGSVVSNPVPDGCIVGGNPARFIGKTTSQ
jgi:acetyltransferase-like isoleucine patch superfamily enzyme